MKHALKLRFLGFLGIDQPFAIAQCFRYGRHVKKNIKIARLYYEEAIRLEIPEAFQELSNLEIEEDNQVRGYYLLGLYNEHKNEWTKALSEFSKAANLNHAESMYQIGCIFSSDKFSATGLLEIKKDHEKEINYYYLAAKLYHKFALDTLARMSETNPKAAYLMGKMYENGEIGDKKNIKQAIRYYEKSQEIPEVAFRLGYIYETGYDFGTDRMHPNLSKAIIYYIAAAHKKNTNSLDALERLAEYLNNNERMLLADAYIKVFGQTVKGLKHYKFLIDSKIQIAANRITDLIHEDSNLAYLLAQLYEGDVFNENKEVVTKACYFYGEAISHGHVNAINCLETLARQGLSEAQFMLAYGYYKIEKFNETITWLLQAVEQRHSKAIQFLDNTIFDAQCYYLIASKYEEGKIVKRKDSIAFDYYKKSFDLGDKKAAFKLGQYYENGIKNKINCNFTTAFNYYAISAEQGDKNSLEGMKRIARKSDTDSAWFLLGDLYRNTFNNEVEALKCYKYLADKNNTDGKDILDQMVNDNPEHAYIVAGLYEHGTKDKKDLLMAYRCYLSAMQRGHKEAEKCLYSLAEGGHSEAQYSLALACYQAKKFDESIILLLQAVRQQHSKAIQFLDDTIFDAQCYYLIASKYEVGEIIERNDFTSFNYYLKAFELGDKKAAYKLGHYYENGIKDKVNRDVTIAFNYYTLLAEQGEKDGLEGMKRIIHQMDDTSWLKLGDIYANIFNKKIEAFKYYKQLLDKNNQDAKEIINSQIAKTPQSAYILGKLYESDFFIKLSQEALANACYYYLIAAKSYNNNAINNLGTLARQDYSEAQYTLAVYYYNNKEFEEAITWLIKATENQHPKVIQFLKDTTFEIKYYLQLADEYENKESYYKSIALECYLKTYELGNSEVAYKIGNFYEHGIEERLLKNPILAFHYYELSARNHNQIGLEGMERIIHQLDDISWIKLGDVYANVFNKKIEAFKCYKRLADRNNQDVLAIIDKAVDNNPDHAYIFGKLYEQDTRENKYFLLACRYYLSAMQGGHKEAEKCLYSLAEGGHSEAQYSLAYAYYQAKKFEEAITWLLQAVEQQNSKAIQFLKEAGFEAKYYSLIAIKYEEGTIVARNDSIAFDYHLKAFELGDKKASFKLGQYYENGIQDKINSDLAIAFNNYAISAEQGNEISFEAMKRIIFSLNDDASWLKLADIYVNTFNNQLEALKCYKYLIDKNNPDVNKIINSQIAKSHQNAFMLGTLYKNDFFKSSREEDLCKACLYYLIAARCNNNEAITSLKSLTKLNYSEAQYTLAVYYYEAKKFEEAITWLIKAIENQHSKVVQFLKDTTFEIKYYLQLASEYENKESYRKNIALECYLKTYDLGNSEVAYKIGNFYEHGIEERLLKNPILALHYYELSARNHNQIGLEGMKRIAQKSDTDSAWLKLGDIYAKTFNNQQEAFRCYKYLADKNNQNALTIINKAANNNPEHACIVGKLYEQDTRNEKYLLIACRYYLSAMQGGHKEAEKCLYSLAKQGHSEAQYSLAIACYQAKKFEEAIKWLLQSVEQQNSKALQFLKEILFEAKYYFLIATEYEKGEIVKRNDSAAFDYYLKAFELDDERAAFKLGHYYENGVEIKINRDLSVAFKLYAILAEQGDKDSLEGMKRIAQELDTDTAWLKLGNIYRFTFNNKMEALKCYKYSADKSNVDAQNSIDRMVKNNPEYAYIVGHLYEHDTREKRYLLIACKCYLFAMQCGHKEAEKCLYSLGERGHSEAQYSLANAYYRANKSEEATSWLLQAVEQGHSKAIQFLKETKFEAKYYFLIATEYEKGEIVKRDDSVAFDYYLKAFELGDKRAAFKLGYYYEKGIEDKINSDLAIAFNYYAISAELSDKNSLERMKKVAKHLNKDKLWLKLGSVYLHKFNNLMEALKCYKYLADKNNEDARKIIHKTIATSPEAAFMLGCLYESDFFISTKEEDIIRACCYYLEAIRKGNNKAVSNVESLAKQDCSEAQYTLAVYYYEAKKFDNAIIWLLQAIGQQHSKIIPFLKETTFEVKHYLQIADAYKSNKSYYKSIIFECYLKAYELGNSEVAHKIGNFYEHGIEEKLPKNLILAFRYYEYSAMSHNKIGLEGMESLAQKSDTDSDWLKLGDIYAKTFNNQQEAFKCYKYLADKNNQDALTIIDKAVDNNPDHAYMVGKLYEQDTRNEKYFLIACKYYLSAMQLGHEEAGKCLYSLAKQGHSEAQYSLAYVHYQTKKFENAITWLLQAVKQEHLKATQFLKETAFEAQHYSLIANEYEQGNIVNKDDSIAFDYYKNAFELGDKEAAFKLGHYYENGIKDKINCDLSIAFNYYAISAELGDENSIEKMKEIIHQLNDDTLWLQLGNVYLNSFANPTEAMKCYKYLADKNNYDVKEIINNLIAKSPRYAFIIGKLYENDFSACSSQADLAKACYYYLISAKSSIDEAIDNLESLAKQNYSEAQYTFAVYYSEAKKFDHAIAWLIKAIEQQHPKAYYHLGLLYQYEHGVKKDLATAIKYYELAANHGYSLGKAKINEILNSNEIISNDLTSIASIYNNGTQGVIKNYSLALVLFQKASEQGNPLAALLLGDFYQIPHEGIQQDLTLAFQAYLHAAKLGNHEALVSLERLGEEVNAEFQLKLSKFYGSIFHNSEKANYWEAKAKEVEQLKLK